MLKGRTIAVAAEATARYTSSKVREAIFNLLGNIEGTRILDLFAGSGSFAIEALSRGASSATCVEIDRDMERLLLKNLESLSLNNCCDVILLDVVYAIPFLYKKASLYDIIFMDPPYERGRIEETMSLLKTHRIHCPEARIIVESSKRELRALADLQGCHESKYKRYGDTAITIISAGHNSVSRSVT
jgi:16S rRNA (guanine(966)-N(2))-methyltransferase RsmD